MIINNHRKHSDFGLRYFIAGTCYTPDAAYVLLYAQLEQIEMDIAAGEAAELEQEAEEIRLAEYKTNKIKKLKNKAELIKLKAAQKNFKINFEATKKEYKSLLELMEELKPQCKYDTSDILQMEQDMQRDEWSEELKARAENMMMGNLLGIGYDHIATMRQHPDFHDKILPHLVSVSDTITTAMQAGKPKHLLEKLTQNFLLDHKPND